MSRRPSFTRAERLAQGLPVCIASGTCDRAPSPRCRGRCRACFDDPSTPRIRQRRGLQPKVPTYHFQGHFPVDLALAIRLEAERRKVSGVALVVEAVTEKARTWGVPP